MNTLIVMKFEAKNGAYPKLKDRIKELMGTYEVKNEEVDQVYNHIINDLI